MSLFVESLEIRRGNGVIRFCESYDLKEIRDHALQYLQDVFGRPLLLCEEEVFLGPETKRYFITPPTSEFTSYLLLYEDIRSVTLTIPHVDWNLEGAVKAYAQTHPVPVKVSEKSLVQKLAIDHFTNSFEGGVFALKRFYTPRRLSMRY